MNKEVKFARICKDIKDIKIQGATNVAKAAIEAYFLAPSQKHKDELFKLRPTEPALFHALSLVETLPKSKILNHFKEAQEKINKNILKIIKSKFKVYTHCHSTNVVKALIYAKKHNKNFEVYNTETRPLFQGRITSKELAKAGIKVTQFVDSAFHEAISNSDIILIGADAILKDGVINKVGSASIADLAKLHKKPLYIIADSWKFSRNKIIIEERDFHEVWNKPPKHIKVRDPAFEKVNKKYIRAIISELGILDFKDFVKIQTLLN
jgi:ribose 1,5-bisphosphate isomerase